LSSLKQALCSPSILQPFVIGKKCKVTVDASSEGLGAVLEQDSRPVLYISRGLSKSERNYSQTQKEALAIVWAVKRLHKYLFNAEFILETDHEALKFIFNEKASMNKNTSFMLQRWQIFLSSYNYSLRYRPGKSIPHADCLSRSIVSKINEDTHSYLIHAIPVDRNLLIRETKILYGSVINSIRNSWRNATKRKFNSLVSKRDRLSISPDGVINFDDRILVPPILKNTILESLHSSHLGADKMLSLAKLSVW